MDIVSGTDPTSQGAGPDIPGIRGGDGYSASSGYFDIDGWLERNPPPEKQATTAPQPGARPAAARVTPGRQTRREGDARERYAREALEKEIQILESTSSHRNDQLNLSAVRLFELVAAGYLPESEVRSRLESSGRQIGLGEREVLATIEQGYKKGITQPRDLSHVGTGKGSARKAGAIAKEGEEAGSHAEACEAFRNYELIEDEGEDGKPKLKREALMMVFLDLELRRFTGNWPRRVGGALFARTVDYKKIDINSSARLFAWIDNTRQVDWAKGGQYITQERLYEHLRMNSSGYDAIETLPHWPPIPGIYYMHEPVPEASGGKLLDQLLDFFRPFSAVDRELIRAYILTLFWGGPPGTRPAFLTTGPDEDEEQGRGVGKSTIVELLANSLANGFIEVSPNVEMHKIDERLLSPEAREIRVVRIDNIKTHRFSWGDLEGRITSPVISGRELYAGEGRRPNTLVFNLTLNGASLSKDMAQRTIVIKLARPPRDAGWKASVVAFIRDNRLGLLAEIRDALLDDPGAFPPVTRWAEWERDVLSKTDDIQGCQDEILKRQAEIDNDKEEQGIVADYFAERIKEYGHDPEKKCVWLPSQMVADWLSRATGESYSVKKAPAHLKGLGVKQLTRDRTEFGRGWVWRAEGAGPNGKPVSLWIDFSAKKSDSQ